MPFNLKHKMIIGSAGLFLIAATTAGIVVFNKPKIEAFPLPTTYSEILENFETGTKIEIIYAHSVDHKIETENLEITENKTRLNHDNDFSDIIYKIEQDDAFIDIHLSQKNNIISAEITGLSKGAKAIINQDNNNLNPATPVDWAGRLTLSSNLKGAFCLSIIEDKTYKICHATTQQVAS